MGHKGLFELTRAGRKVLQKTSLALFLSSVLPLLLIVHLIESYVLPNLDPGDTLQFTAIHLLAFCTLLSIAAGGYMIWDLGCAVAALARLVEDDSSAPHGASLRGDELGSISQWFATNVDVMNRQAQQLAELRVRLIVADEELARAKTTFETVSIREETSELAVPA